MDDYQYAIEWFAYGFNDKNEEYIVKFMMYWIAFNWLYNKHYVKHEQDGRTRRLKYEHEKIEEFCDANMDKLLRAGVFDSGDVDIFKDEAIGDGTIGKTPPSHKRVHDNLRFGTDSVKNTSLLLSIYFVRCNLFHGSKSIRVRRDLDLVKASAKILEEYLRVLLPPEQLEAKLSETANL